MKRFQGQEAATAMIEALHACGRIGRKEDIAEMAVFLAGDSASWCTGQAYIVDGGYTAP
jgi:NAD(P)-dependent dehydrogenase (short-subunit alcohol dehydrogenase family)